MVLKGLIMNHKDRHPAIITSSENLHLDGILQRMHTIDGYQPTDEESEILLRHDPDFSIWMDARMDEYRESLENYDESQEIQYEKENHDVDFLLTLKESETRSLTAKIPRHTKQLIDEYHAAADHPTKSDAIDYMLLKGLATLAKDDSDAVEYPFKDAIRETEFYSESIPTENPLSHQDVINAKTEEVANLLLGIPLRQKDLREFAHATPASIMKRLDCTPEVANRIALTYRLSRDVAASHVDAFKVSSPSDVADFFMPHMRDLKQEVVVVACLDTKGNNTHILQITEDEKAEFAWNGITSHKRIFTGSLNASVFHPREVFRYAIEMHANSICLLHNHPSGDPQPSTEDIRATKQLIEAGNHIGIKVLDHIIIGDGIFYSMKEEGNI